MTALFQDIKSILNTPKQKDPIPGIHFAEILYADDTMIFGTHTHTINKLLQAIQEESAKYNMALNLDPCVNLTVNRTQSSTKFLDASAYPVDIKRNIWALHQVTASTSLSNSQSITTLLEQGAYLYQMETSSG